MTKYVVSGYIGFDNFGDEAIAKILTDKLKSEGAEKITLISANPAKTSELYNVNSCKMLDFLLPVIQSDTLISGGGSLLQDVTSTKSLIYYLTIIFTALFLKKEVIIYSQGIGPINSKIGQFLTKIALKHCTKISVRDKKSQELLKKWDIESTLVTDPVFTIELPKKNKQGTVGIQLRAFNTLTDKFLINLAKEISLRFSDKQIKIFSLQDSIDFEVCQKFKELLIQNGINNIDLLSDMTVNEVFESISELEYLIGMRFHADVAGIKSGVRTLVINYDPKVENLANEYNLPLINLDEEDFSHAFEKLMSL